MYMYLIGDQFHHGAWMAMRWLKLVDLIHCQVTFGKVFYKNRTLFWKRSGDLWSLLMNLSESIVDSLDHYVHKICIWALKKSIAHMNVKWKERENSKDKLRLRLHIHEPAPNEWQKFGRCVFIYAYKYVGTWKLTSRFECNAPEAVFLSISLLSKMSPRVKPTSLRVRPENLRIHKHTQTHKQKHKHKHKHTCAHTRTCAIKNIKSRNQNQS